MLRVKICGITRGEDALRAAEMGADAIGFIFYPKSPRYILPDEAFEIARQLPEHVSRVGVFVDPPAKALQDHLDSLGLDALQIHGDHDLPALRQIGARRVICAFQVGKRFDINLLAEYRGIAAYLLDTYRRGSYGGTGATFDWTVARQAKTYGRIILAGGLHPQNIRLAVKQAVPYAIDVNSGVESRPGVKDKRKLQQLFNNLKEFRNGWQKDARKWFPLA